MGSTGESQGYAEPLIVPDPLLAARIARGGLWVAATSYAGMAVGFGATLFLTRVMNPSDFGLYALGYFFFTIFNFKYRLGVDTAFAQDVGKAGAGTHVALSLTTGLATVGLSLLTLPVMVALGLNPTIGWIAVTLSANHALLETWGATARILFEKDLCFGPASLVTFLSFSAGYVPAIYCALHGAGPWSIVVQNVVYTFLNAALMWGLLRAKLPAAARGLRFDLSLAKRYLRFGWAVGMSGLGNAFLFQFDNFLVGVFLGPAVLGFYDRAYRIAQWPHQLVSAALTRSAFYAYARLQGDRPALARAVNATHWLITRLAAPVAVGAFAASGDLVRLLYGERWADCAFYLRLLLVFSVLRPLLENTGSLFVAVGRPGIQTRVVMAQALVLALAATPLTPLLKVPGTALGVALSFAAGLWLTYRHLRETVDFSVFRTFSAPVAALVSSFGMLALLESRLDLAAFSVLGRTVLKGTLYAGVYLVVLVALQPRDTWVRLADLKRWIFG